MASHLSAGPAHELITSTGRAGLAGLAVGVIQPLNAISVDSSTLDVGCGSRAMLCSMHHQVFRHLTGIDQLINEPILADGLRVLKVTSDLTEQFDFIMSHHLLDHIADPIAALRYMRRALRPHGHLLVRLPIAGIYGWRRCRVNWVGLDPRRHIFTPTLAGMKKLVERGSFEIKTYCFDSNESTLLLSQKHERGFPGYDREPRFFSAVGFLTEQQIAEVRRRAARVEGRW